MESFLKYLTPALITMISLLFSFLISVIVVAILLVVFRKSSIAKRIFWHIKELNKLLSSELSYYSTKRIRSMVAFYSGVGVILCYDWLHRQTITASEIGLHSGLLLTSVYAYTKFIQTEKKDTKSDVPLPTDKPDTPADANADEPK